MTVVRARLAGALVAATYPVVARARLAVVVEGAAVRARLVGAAVVVAVPPLRARLDGTVRVLGPPVHVGVAPGVAVEPFGGTGVARKRRLRNML